MDNSGQKRIRFNVVLEPILIPANPRTSVRINRSEIFEFQRPRTESAPEKTITTRGGEKSTSILTCPNRHHSRGNKVFKGKNHRIKRIISTNSTFIRFQVCLWTKDRSFKTSRREILTVNRANHARNLRKSKFKTNLKSENVKDKARMIKRTFRNCKSEIMKISELSEMSKRFATNKNVFKRKRKNVSRRLEKSKDFYRIFRMSNRFFRQRGRGGYRGRGGHKSYAQATRANPLFTMRVEIEAVPPENNPKQKRTHQMLACYLEPIIHGKNFLDLPRDWLDDKKIYPEENDCEEKLGHKWTLKLTLNKRIDMARFDKEEYTIGSGEHIWKFKIGGRDSSTPKTRWRVMDGNRGFKWLPDIDMKDPTSYSTLLTEKIKEFVNGKVVMLGKVKVETTTMIGFKENITGKLMFHTSEVTFQESELREGKAASFKLPIYCGGYREPVNIWIQPLIPGNLKISRKCKKCGLTEHEEKDCTFEGPSYDQKDYSLYGQRAVEDIPGITKQIDEKKANLIYLAKTVLKKYENEKQTESTKTFGQLAKELDEVSKACDKLAGREPTSGKHQLHQLANLLDGEYSVNWDIPKEDMGRMAFFTKSLVNDNGASFNWIVVRGTEEKMRQEIQTTGKLREVLNGVTIQSLANLDRDRLVYLHETYEVVKDPKRDRYIDTLGERFVIATELVVSENLEIYKKNNKLIYNTYFRYNYYSHSRKRNFKVWTLSSPILKRVHPRRNRRFSMYGRITVRKRRKK